MATIPRPRYTVADWAIGLLAFVLVSLLALPILFTILKATAPYGWNKTILFACPVFLAYQALKQQRA
jgi:hypothetical protein